MLNPAFFTENQSGVNPHDSLTDRDDMSKEEQSAQIIISHVTQGLQLAEKITCLNLFAISSRPIMGAVRRAISTYNGKTTIQAKRRAMSFSPIQAPIPSRANKPSS